MPYQSREADLAAAFVDLAHSLVGDGFDVIGFLHTLTEHCVRLLDVAAVGVLLSSPQDRPLDVAASDDDVHALQAAEVEQNERPGQDCCRHGLAIPDVPFSHPHARAIWPRFSRAAHDLGFTPVATVRGAAQARPGTRRHGHHQHPSPAHAAGHLEADRSAADRAVVPGDHRQEVIDSMSSTSLAPVQDGRPGSP
jgi:hypothetical protein